MSTPNYRQLTESEVAVLLEDAGPWDQHPTITNAAEQVVKEMFPKLAGRRLLYFDSEGRLTELLVKDGKFAGFAHPEPANKGGA